MKTLNWPGPEIKTTREPDYEWAYIKAHLVGNQNVESARVYAEMFSTPAAKNVPYWLVRLAVFYGALEIGYARTKRKMPGVDKVMAACVQRLNENELRNNVVLWHHMCLHDLEDAKFGGRELTE